MIPRYIDMMFAAPIIYTPIYIILFLKLCLKISLVLQLLHKDFSCSCMRSWDIVTTYIGYMKHKAQGKKDY